MATRRGCRATTSAAIVSGPKPSASASIISTVWPRSRAAYESTPKRRFDRSQLVTQFLVNSVAAAGIHQQQVEIGAHTRPRNILQPPVCAIGLRPTRNDCKVGKYVFRQPSSRQHPNGGNRRSVGWQTFSSDVLLRRRKNPIRACLRCAAQDDGSDTVRYRLPIPRRPS
jgi:hypothetical protein